MVSDIPASTKTTAMIRVLVMETPKARAITMANTGTKSRSTDAMNDAYDQSVTIRGDQWARLTELERESGQTVCKLVPTSAPSPPSPSSEPMPVALVAAHCGWR